MHGTTIKKMHGTTIKEMHGTTIKMRGTTIKVTNIFVLSHIFVSI
jgi:hypothetical protein